MNPQDISTKVQAPRFLQSKLTTVAFQLQWPGATGAANTSAAQGGPCPQDKDAGGSREETRVCENGAQGAGWVCTPPRRGVWSAGLSGKPSFCIHSPPAA